MPEMNAAPTSGLPSSRSLIRSTLIAAAVAVVLLVTVVLPAEYGVDPTRVGSLLGLTRMGEIKVALAKEAALAETTPAPVSTSTSGTGALASPGSTSEPSTRNHVTEVILRPSEGKEVKLVMRKDTRVTFSWATDRGVVNYDTHADAPGIKYHGYAKGTGKGSDEGVLVAAFDGAHGWFWRNRGREVVTVTLRTNGDYQELKGP
ncbi:MAG: transmembrane anchor protein [Gemmatimonadota bacterium]|nr:transmembrane anchor protein [Gemmatimonadota bacterium]